MSRGLEQPMRGSCLCKHVNQAAARESVIDFRESVISSSKQTAGGDNCSRSPASEMFKFPRIEAQVLSFILYCGVPTSMLLVYSAMYAPTEDEKHARITKGFPHIVNKTKESEKDIADFLVKIKTNSLESNSSGKLDEVLRGGKNDVKRHGTGNENITGIAGGPIIAPKVAQIKAEKAKKAAKEEKEAKKARTWLQFLGLAK